MTSKKSRSGTGSGSDLNRDQTETETRELVPDRDRDHETLILPDLETETRSGTALGSMMVIDDCCGGSMTTATGRENIPV